MSTGPNGHVVVFARHPESDAPKRRLVPRVGDAGARLLHRAFLRDTLAAVRASGARVVLAHTEGPAFDELALVDHALVQVGASFGARLDRALADAHALCGMPQLVLGVDTPQLGPARLESAFERLLEADAVIGPSPRGGFHVLGLRAAAPAFAHVFDAPGEGPRLLEFLRGEGRAVLELEACTDIDLPEDLEALASELGARDQQTGAWIPHATAAALGELGLGGAAPGGRR